MRKFFATSSLLVILASAALAKDPIDAQIEQTGKLKNETLADAIRWEKAKLAAADREARKSPARSAAAKKAATPAR